VAAALLELFGFRSIRANWIPARKFLDLLYWKKMSR